MNNNFYQNWYLEHKQYDIRNYADRILNIELPKAFNENDVVVLAAAPNSGKTLLAIAWMEKYLLENPEHRILVLTHGQSMLRNQFYNDIKDAQVNFSCEKIDTGEDYRLTEEQVLITLPQSIINTIDTDDNVFDVLVVDEAHNFYCAKDGMIERIIGKYKFKKQLLLTGTPAPFIALKMDIIPVALEELIEGGWASDPIVLISKSNYKIDKKDFNQDGELKKNVQLDSEKTIDALNGLFTIIKNKLKIDNWKDIGKTLIVAKNIDQAKDIKKYFKNIDIKAIVSTSENDVKSKNIKKFVEKDINFLIVVNRAILGFNLPSLINVIDIKCGKNISNLFQLFNRITRLHPERKQKYFFKVVPEAYETEYLYLLSAAISLMIKSNYIKYNGTNDEIVIPVIKTNILKKEEVGKIRKKGIWKFEPINYIDVPISKMWKDENKLYSYNSLKKIQESLDLRRNWILYSEEENYQFCLKEIKDYYNIP